MRASLITSLMAVSTLMATELNAIPKAEVWSFWLAHAPGDNTTIDHSAWQLFLDRYLRADGDGINRVRYQRVVTADRLLLQGYLTTLTDSDPRRLNRDEQLAYWINLYNALTVELVLDHPDRGSILRMGAGFLAIGPWNQELITIAGQPVTLNDIEHRILRAIWQDHRIHYALNCASIGCPNLNAEAYTAANTEQLLVAAEHTYINHERAVAFTGSGKLQLSSLFKWYRQDFAGNRQELLAYLARHHHTLGARLAEYDRGIVYKYDWNLNRAVEAEQRN